ncbi:hypothetical protein GF380_02425, partial [Candidatus Uhrbacteria bacterium]|nr:hypothetical protein [Candidatus Uhrbacteria bacterium]
MHTGRIKKQRKKAIERLAANLVANAGRPEVVGGKYTHLPDGRRYNPEGVRLSVNEHGEFT